MSPRKGSRKKPKAVAAHVFAGGFSLGVQQAGFKVIAHLEGSDYGREETDRNMPKVKRYDGVDEWPLEKLGPSCDLFFANPPCAPWSNAGAKPGINNARKNPLDDPRTKAVDEVIHAIEVMDPSVVMWESVQQMFTRGRVYVEEKAEHLMSLGYSVWLVLYDNQHLGLPQVRRRFMIVGSKFEIDLELRELVTAPPAREVLEGIEPGPNNPTTSPMETIAWHLYNDHPTKVGGPLRLILEKKYREEYGKDKELWPRNERGNLLLPGFIKRRLDPDEPCNVTMGNNLLHWDEPRTLSINEMKALAGYPPDYWFRPNNRGQTLISQAVLPPCGKWFGTRALEAIQAAVPVRRKAVRYLDLENDAIHMSRQLELELKQAEEEA